MTFIEMSHFRREGWQNIFLQIIMRCNLSLNDRRISTLNFNAAGVEHDDEQDFAGAKENNDYFLGYLGKSDKWISLHQWLYPFPALIRGDDKPYSACR